MRYSDFIRLLTRGLKVNNLSYVVQSTEKWDIICPVEGIQHLTDRSRICFACKSIWVKLGDNRNKTEKYVEDTLMPYIQNQELTRKLNGRN